MENTSGQGALASVPAEIDRWNWGACILNWVWGIGNNTVIALLVFIPVVNFAMPFVLGAKGSAWAWRNKQWESVEEFKRIQRKWARWSFILLGLMALFMVVLFFGISAGLKSSEAYKLSVALAEDSAETAEIIGKPFSSGMPMGNIHVSGPSGNANLSFAVKGPKGKGTVYVEAEKDMGRWKINRIVLEQDATGKRVDLGK
jgi:hypothetical protein